MNRKRLVRLPDLSDKAQRKWPVLTPAQWVKREIPPTEPLLGDLFTTTSRCLLAADTGLGKTMLAMAWAFAMRLRCDFLHWKVRRHARVLYIDGEMPRDLMQDRIRIACDWFDVKPPRDGLIFLSREDFEDMPALDSAEGQKWLNKKIRTLGPFDFIIFDNIMSLCSSIMKDEESWHALLPFVLSLTKRRIGQLWLHHTGHDKGRQYGTKTREWQMDTSIVGERARAGALVSMTLKFDKHRRRKPSNWHDFDRVLIELTDEGWSYQQAEDDAGSPRGRPNTSEEKALRALSMAMFAKEEEPVTEDAWRKQALKLGISKSKNVDTFDRIFRRVRGVLVAKGLVKKQGDKYEVARTK